MGGDATTAIALTVIVGSLLNEYPSTAGSSRKKPRFSL
jgi:hypothetical protein